VAGDAGDNHDPADPRPNHGHVIPGDNARTGSVRVETERLVLRELTSEDVELLVDLDSDPAVMHYITNGVATPRTEVDGQIAALITEYAEHPGLGRWAAIERTSGVFVGWFALSPTPPGAAELGYRLRSAYWRRGLGSEGASALVRMAFEDVGLDRVWAQTMAVNAGSRAVMARAGLRYVRTFYLEFDDPIPGTELGEVEYAITRDEVDTVACQSRARSTRVENLKRSAPVCLRAAELHVGW
jgi:RimJ/RimL family protein N-acetyltransferase